MEDQNSLQYTAFEGEKLLSSGSLDQVALKVKKRLKANQAASILIFSDSTGKQMDLDLRGSDSEILERMKIYLSPKSSEQTTTGPGRPKLGVVSREISLLPRHWEWLATQPGGASVTLRKLVDEARKSSEGKESAKVIQERTYQFMSVLAGNLPNYEEALRALYAKDKKKFQAMIRDWPVDVRDHSKNLSDGVWA